MALPVATAICVGAPVIALVADIAGTGFHGGADSAARAHDYVACFSQNRSDRGTVAPAMGDTIAILGMMGTILIDVTIIALGAGREAGSQSRRTGNDDGKQKGPGAHCVLLVPTGTMGNNVQRYYSLPTGLPVR
jgi:hypothetical protein